LNLDADFIKNILTIRYNPLDPSINPTITWKDFRNTIQDKNGFQTEELLEKSITKNLSNKKSISISLSGGIDSTLCLGLIRKIFPEKKIFGFCGVFGEGNDESKIAGQVANQFDTDFHIVHMDSIFSSMPEIISITKKPKWNTYVHLIAKKSKHYSTNLVTGDGADELFGGYTFRYNKFLHLLKSSDNWKIKTMKYLECHNRDWVPDQKQMFGNKIHFDWEEIYEYFRSSFQNKLCPLQQVMLADYNGKLLYDFIPLGKTISSFYKITNFPIFLDPEIVYFASKISLDQKYNHSKDKGKLLLREISKRLGIKHFEQKKGFSPGLLIDWKSHGKDISKQFLQEKYSHIYKHGLINFDWVQKAFQIVDNDGDIRYLNRLISILALEIWYRLEITHEMKPSTKL